MNCDICGNSKNSISPKLKAKWQHPMLYDFTVLITSGVLITNQIIKTFCLDCAESLDEKYGDRRSWRKGKEVGTWKAIWQNAEYIAKENLKNDFLSNFNELQKEVVGKTKKRRALEDKERSEQAKREEERFNKLKKSIIKLLKDKAVKMPASDIDAFLKHQNVDEIKELCEQMYPNGEISRTANYRYFILSEEKKNPKKASAPKSGAGDVKAELKKYKEMLDDGLIEQEDYDAKKKELLGL